MYSILMRILLIILFIFFSNCTIKKVVRHHGIHFLEEKKNNIFIDLSNKNDVRKILGPPSTISSLESELWIYVERKTTVSNIKNLGRRELLKNDILALKFNNKGILINKEFFNKEDLNNLKISENSTTVVKTNEGLVNTTLDILRKKINDPLGNRNIK
jgi:outer membrane protein assembly factor BamE (lipoprotein component of BamABCDE complex)